MRSVILVLQQILAWVKVAEGAVQMMPTDGGWKDDFLALTSGITREITIFLETHPQAPSTVARGYAATVAFCNSVLSRLDLLVAATDKPKDERLAQARELTAELDDPAKVYQAKKGDDANALRGARAAAQRRIETIQNQ